MDLTGLQIQRCDLTRICIYVWLFIFDKRGTKVRYNTHATQRFIIYNFFFFLNDCIIISTTFFVFVFRLAAVSDPHLHHHTQIYLTFFSFWKVHIIRCVEENSIAFWIMQLSKSSLFNQDSCIVSTLDHHLLLLLWLLLLLPFIIFPLYILIITCFLKRFFFFFFFFLALQTLLYRFNGFFLWSY